MLLNMNVSCCVLDVRHMRAWAVGGHFHTMLTFDNDKYDEITLMYRRPSIVNGLLHKI